MTFTSNTHKPYWQKFTIWPNSSHLER